MTSVPHLSRISHRDHLDNIAGDIDHPLFTELKSIIPPKLIKIRHIRSIIIKRIRLNFKNLKKTNTNDFHKRDLNPDDTTSHEKQFDDNTEQRRHNLASITTENGESRQVIRKGKSSYDLNSKFNSTIPVSEAYDEIQGDSPLSRDDNFINIKVQHAQKDDTINNVVLNRPHHIQRQIDSQTTNYDTFFDCFYTINDFLDLNNPYFVSRVFPSHVEIADELELRIFSNSATVNLFIKSETHSWQLLCQYHIKLSLLLNLGDDLQLIETTLKNVDNLLLIKLSDDCYYALPNSSISADVIKKLKSNYINKTIEKVENFHYNQYMCTYDQIMTLNNYSRCIHDLLYTKQILNNKISLELTKETSLYKICSLQTTLDTSNKHLEALIDQKLHHNYNLKTKIAQLEIQKKKLQDRINQMKYPPKVQKSETGIDIVIEINSIQSENKNLATLINLEKARISSMIQYIFPMQPIEGKHDFSLFQTCFPSSLIPHHNFSEDLEAIPIIPISTISSTIIQRLTQISRPHSERLNSLIGNIALIIVTVADIFNISLRYPIKYFGSNTYINDPISNMKNPLADKILSKQLNDPSATKMATIYPLFICQNATLAVKFTYALLLLRKDLEQLFETEEIVKVEEFNLLIASKIWLTCVEAYSDMTTLDGDNSVMNNTEEESFADVSTLDAANNNSFIDEQMYEDAETERIQSLEQNVKFSIDDKKGSPSLSPLLNTALHRNSARRVSNSSKMSKYSTASFISKFSNRSATSGMSAVSVESNVNSIVNEYNQSVLSEERIRHIKKHLLKSSNGKL